MSPTGLVLFICFWAFILFARKHVFPKLKSIWQLFFTVPVAGVVAVIAYVYGDIYKFPEGKLYAVVIFSVVWILSTKLLHKVLRK